MTDERNLWLDLFRGLSAVAVCGSHLRAATISDYGSVTVSKLLAAPFFVATGLGHQAVVVFFVLSGYFVGGSILKNRERFSWSNYLTARLVRLWVVLLPALLFTVACDQFLAARAPEVLAGSYESQWHSGPSGEFSNSWVTFLGNLGFLQTIAVPVYGTNSPLWSLANEFWYYLLFPAIASAVGWVPPRNLGLRIGSAAAAAGIVAMLPKEMIVGFLVWCMGVLAWQFTQVRRTRLPPWFVWVAGLGFVAALAYTKSGLASRIPIHRDLVLGVCFTLFAATVSEVRFPRLAGATVETASRFLSEISYSLYLFHFPALMVLVVVLFETKVVRFGLQGIAAYLGALAFLLLMGAAAWWLFERRTPVVRRTVRSWLSRCVKSEAMGS